MTDPRRLAAQSKRDGIEWLVVGAESIRTADLTAHQ
jgi:hypothetical protein